VAARSRGSRWVTAIRALGEGLTTVAMEQVARVGLSDGGRTSQPEVAVTQIDIEAQDGGEHRARIGSPDGSTSVRVG